MTASSETPRTKDACKKALAALDGDYAFAFGHLQGFAEMIERELAACREELEKAKAALTPLGRTSLPESQAEIAAKGEG